MGMLLRTRGRYLAAGAVRSFWVRTRTGDLAVAMPRIRKEIAGAENVVIESNSILRFLRPDLYLSVLDPGVGDFKDSAKYFLDRADAVLVAEGGDWPAGVEGGFAEAGGGGASAGYAASGLCDGRGGGVCSGAVGGSGARATGMI